MATRIQSEQSRTCLGEKNITELAAEDGVSPAYVTRVLRLAFFAPVLTDALLAGRQRAGISAKYLTLETEIPALWAEQKAMVLAG